jgi:Rrf2 family protein
MPVTAKAEYACLAMLELAARYADGRPVRLSEVTDKHNIHHGFLVQILLQLKTARLVTTTRGKSGGYQLTRPPSEITLADIVAVLDGLSEPEAREGGGSAFAQTLSVIWSGLAKAVVETRSGYLKQFTLSDLLSQPALPDYVI